MSEAGRSSECDTDQRPKLKSSLVLREESDEGGILFDYENDNLVFLNRTGAVLVWFVKEMCENTIDSEGLTATLVSKHGECQREAIAKDIAAFWERLERVGMLAPTERNPKE